MSAHLLKTLTRQVRPMLNAVLLVHLLIAAAMIGVVLLQKSEGGGLGMGGGGGGGGGFLTGRGTANLLTRTTAVLAACFFMTSIALSLLSNRPTGAGSVFDGKPGATKSDPGKPAEPAGSGGVLDKLKQGQGFDRLPTVPQNN